MKLPALIITTLFSTSFCRADCAGGGLYVWPETATVKQNPILIIEAYSHSQFIVQNIGKDNNAYLKSGEKTISLTVVETCQGEYMQSQIILRPSALLEVGKVYTLYVDNLPSGENITRWNSEKQKHEQISWKAEEGIDTDKPTWTQKPGDPEKRYVQYSCGPAQSVNYTFAINESSAVLLKTTVTSVETNKTTTYYLHVQNNTAVSIGHGMCNGAFAFRDGKDYQVTFEIVDGSGNSTPWTWNALKFTRPEVSDLGEE